MRRSYAVTLEINGIQITEVVIDPHYESKHSETINDDLILELVHLLSGKFYEPVAERDGFRYFVADPIELNGRDFRLVWLLEQRRLYVGVVNAFRR